MVPHLWWQFLVYFQSIWISFIFVPALLLKKEKKNLKFYVLFGDTSSGVPDPPSVFLGAVRVQPQEGRGQRLTVLLCRRAGLVHMPI